MKQYFEEKFEKFSYEFIWSKKFPEKELVTCVFAILTKDWKIYLTKNKRWWELPWWHIELWETFDEALEREMNEEIGTWIKSKELFWYKKYHNFEKVENREGSFYPFPNSYILFYIWKWNWKNCKINCSDTLDYWLFSIEEAIKIVKSEWTKKIIKIMIEEL